MAGSVPARGRHVFTGGCARQTPAPIASYLKALIQALNMTGRSLRSSLQIWGHWTWLALVYWLPVCVRSAAPITTQFTQCTTQSAEYTKSVQHTSPIHFGPCRPAFQAMSSGMRRDSIILVQTRAKCMVDRSAADQTRHHVPFHLGGCLPTMHWRRASIAPDSPKPTP